MHVRRPLALAATAVALAACPALAAAQATFDQGVLTDPKGMTLYTWDNDVAGSGKSLCVGACAMSWTPFLAGADAKAAGDFTIVTRDDGAKQWAYKGKPLHRWVDDKKPGDRNGDGFRHLWHVVTP
jgi:predicted lipoprotein with Yx(FWY)xxD motif